MSYRLDKNSDTSNVAVFEDINYELACVMYNIGAVHGAIAANESRTDVDVSLAFLPIKKNQESLNRKDAIMNYFKDMKFSHVLVATLI